MQLAAVAGGNGDIYITIRNQGAWELMVSTGIGDIKICLC